MELKLKFESGKSARATLDTEVTQRVSQGGEPGTSHTLSWKSDMRQRVLDVEPDGSAHVVYVTIPTEGIDEAAAAGVVLQRQVAYVHLDPQGRYREQTPVAPPAVCVLPEGPVEEGATWSAPAELAFPALGQSVRYEQQYRLEAAETLDGVACARISVRTEPTRAEVPLFGGNVARVRLDGDAALWVGLDGRVLRQEVRTHAVTTVGITDYETTTAVTQRAQ